MQRLIDLEVARAYAEERWPSPVVRRHIDALLDGCPKVEVPQIVRCKDCLNRGDYHLCPFCREVEADLGDSFCYDTFDETEDDWFCCMGRSANDNAAD